MKRRGTLVQHAGRELLLVEAGWDRASRGVNVLVRPGDTTFPQEPGLRPLRWLDQGEWYPVARWSEEGLVIPEARHAAQRAPLERLVADYLARHDLPPARAWAVRQGDVYAGEVARAVPLGLAALVHDNEADAGPDPVPVHDVALFLTHLVRLGYAGALWGGKLPVFVCLDPTGDLQFLRISGARGKVTMELLDERGAWLPYEGQAALEFLDNREACDERLVAALGKVPVLDWPAQGLLFSVGPAGERAGVLTSAEDGLRHGVLFSRRDEADEYLAEAEEPLWRAFAVTDVPTFLRRPELQECVVQLNPGQHRARGGLLWSDGDAAVLDSFSGFWRLADGRFEALATDDEASEA